MDSCRCTLPRNFRAWISRKGQDIKGISCNIITSHHTETLNCSTVLKNMAFAPAYVSATLHKSKIKLNALMDTSNQALLCY